MSRFLLCGLLACLVILEATVVSVHAQPARLRYQERRIGQVQAPMLFTVGQEESLLAAVHRAGVYRLTGPRYTPVPVPPTNNADGYEDSECQPCIGAESFVLQRGFLGYRLFRIESDGSATLIAPDSNKVMFAAIRGLGMALVTTTDSSSTIRTYATADCGRSWFQADGSALVANIALVTREQSPLRFFIASPFKPGTMFPVRIGIDYSKPFVGYIGSDSIAWMSHGIGSRTPDTMWYAPITDSSQRRFQAPIRVEGVADSVDQSHLSLVTSPKGNLFMFSSRGWFAKYANGRWVYVDSCPGFEAGILTALYRGYIRIADFDADPIIIDSWNLDSLGVGRIRDTLDPQPSWGVISTTSIRPVTSSKTSFVYESESQPFVIQDSTGQRLLNAAFSGFDASFQPTPTLFGWVDPVGTPIVTGIHDMALAIDDNELPVVRNTSMRGESHGSVSQHGPRIQSRRGLRAPLVVGNRVLTLGNSIRELDLGGRVIRTLYSEPATAVLPLDTAASRLLIGSGSQLIWPSEAMDTVRTDVGPLLSDSLPGGFVHSINRLHDGSMLALVSGLQNRDVEQGVNVDANTGGALRSTDGGRTWNRCTMPISTPYFLGYIQRSNGILLASATIVVRDSSRIVIEPGIPVNESSYHTMLDRYVLRSSDDGRTWTVVHTSPVSRAFRLVGGNGGVTDVDGSMLLVTTDGLLKSTDNGDSWDLHDVAGIDQSHEIISLFQDSATKRVYYCTTGGLYQTMTTTHVSEHLREREHRIALVSSWTEHVMRWNKLTAKVIGITAVDGSVALSHGEQPSSLVPGCYIVHVRRNTTSYSECILVTAP